ncbi:hypothetical protein K402DRAFT_387361 [Aulographum hederae CBS 113979]|uniref:Pyridoxamine 5'-phosphate oxidase N-terminal domain-containing protein n=1 Tax=Aulographum hederae CBS 113979 TaxID=1176131 RepID=A0A6G1GJ88_9PEZI|nr:hypothetical protein K402DRAFT_387361 [Aulographum hederae CBS 113979]
MPNMAEPNPSSSNSNPQTSSTLPPEVITCLENARFLHLATCHSQTPHISLMNYTYLPSVPASSSTPTSSPPHPTIIMTTPPSSRKTLNLASNPLVSLLVHDWVSHRPPTLSTSDASPNNSSSNNNNPLTRTRTSSPPPAARSSLASLLLGINTAALSRISVTLNGSARLLDVGSEEEKWCKARHIENHTFEEGPGSASQGLFGSGGGPGGAEGDGGTGHYIEGEEVRVVVVKIEDGRIADWKGEVRDFVVGNGGSSLADERGREGLVNGDT